MPEEGIDLTSASPDPRALLLAEPPLARARLAFARVADPPRRDAVRVGNPELVLFQPADFVAQPCRLLELEAGGRFPHALFEVGEIRFEIVPAEMRPLVAPGADHP